MACSRALQDVDAVRPALVPSLVADADVEAVILGRLHLILREHRAGRQMLPAGLGFDHVSRGDREAIGVAATFRVVPGMSAAGFYGDDETQLDNHECEPYVNSNAGPTNDGINDLVIIRRSHHCTRTRATPPMPIARAAPVLRSMQRPFTNGPRSLIRTVTDRPLARLVTRTVDPNARVL